MTHYCPVCYKEIPESAYGNMYIGCIPMYNLDKTGLVSTGKGTMKLGEKPGEFETWFPIESFIEWINTIREKQKTGSVRIGRCR